MHSSHPPTLKTHVPASFADGCAEAVGTDIPGTALIALAVIPVLSSRPSHSLP